MEESRQPKLSRGIFVVCVSLLAMTEVLWFFVQRTTRQGLTNNLCFGHVTKITIFYCFLITVDDYTAKILKHDFAIDNFECWILNVELMLN